MTKELRLEQALNVLKDGTVQAYDAYTSRLEAYAIKHSYSLKFVDLDAFQRSNRAKLSQAIGAASKSSKAVVILHYIKQFAVSPDFNMSVREVDEVMKNAVGRSVHKSKWMGLFDRGDEGRSPYFIDAKYRKKVMSSAIVEELKIEIDELDVLIKQASRTRTNPFQEKVEMIMKQINYL
ncbi:hypothetical protein ACPV5R_18725 [Vibrio astriarenae]